MKEYTVPDPTSKQPNEKEGGFKGQFANLKLSDLIQMGAQGRMDLILHITQDQDEGQIYIHGGEIIHAATHTKVGIDAFYEIMSWKSGDFKAEGYATPPEQTITLPWEHLLIEAHRCLDEKKYSESSTRQETILTDPLKENISESLVSWAVSHPLVKEMGLFSPDEIIPLYQRDESSISQKGLALSRASTRLSEILCSNLRFSPCTEVFVEGADATLLLHFISPDLLIYTYFEENISGKIIFNMELSSLIKSIKAFLPVDTSEP